MYNPYLLKDVKASSDRKLFSVVSTFAGGGGSSTGYKLAGGEVLCVNEFVKEAQETYLANYPNTPLLSGDIREITSNDILQAAGITKGELDIFDGSPPCVAFSENGGNYKNWNEDRKYSNTTLRNAEDLFFDFLGIANELQPKIIIAENVRGLGYSYAKPYFNKIINTMNKIGYVSTAKLLDASYFGVPQSRIRYFFVGIRKDIAAEKKINRLNISKRVYPIGYDTQTVVGDAIKDLLNDPRNIADGKELELRMQRMAKYEYVKQFKGKSIDRPLKMSTIHPKGSYFNTTRLLYDYPSWALTQAGLAPDLQTHLHPDFDRGITIMEAKRLMSLPDDFILTGKVKQQYERIGRMVAPLQMKAVAEHLYKEFLS